MLEFLGRGSATLCDGSTRRDFLKVGALGALGFSLADYFAAKAAGNVVGADDRAAIMIFNLGATSQLDTFDMKPDAPAEIRGPFKPISTASSEIQISEILPLCNAMPPSICTSKWRIFMMRLPPSRTTAKASGSSASST